MPVEVWVPSMRHILKGLQDACCLQVRLFYSILAQAAKISPFPGGEGRNWFILLNLRTEDKSLSGFNTPDFRCCGFALFWKNNPSFWAAGFKMHQNKCPSASCVRIRTILAAMRTVLLLAWLLKATAFGVR